MINLDAKGNYNVATKKGESEATQIIINVFTTKEGYFRYGEQNNLNFDGLLKFEKAALEYGVSSGAIEIFETTGKVPQWYLDTEEEIYNKYLGKAEQNKTIYTPLSQRLFWWC